MVLRARLRASPNALAPVPSERGREPATFLVAQAFLVAQDGTLRPVTTIYHMLPWPDWERAQGKAEYTAPSLASQGFLHASADLDQLLWVANRLYRGHPRLAVLCTACGCARRSRTSPADTLARSPTSTAH